MSIFIDIAQGRLHNVKEYLESGRLPHIQDRGGITLLHQIAGYKTRYNKSLVLDIMKRLLDAGCDPSILNDTGFSML